MRLRDSSSQTADAHRIMEVDPKTFCQVWPDCPPGQNSLDFVFGLRHSQVTRREAQAHVRKRSPCWAGHYWGKTRKGNSAIKRKTASSRFGRAVQSIAQWCRLNRHRPVSEQHFKLRQKLHGHYAYYGINGNYAALHRFHHEVYRRWFKWLNRRNRQRELSWELFSALVKRYPLPAPRIVHRFT